MNATATKKTKIKIKKPQAYELKGYGEEPTWADVDKMAADEYMRKTMAAVNWYYNFYSKKDAQEWFAAWLTDHSPKRKNLLKYVNAAKPDVFMNITSYMYAMELQGWKARLPVLRHVVKNLKDIVASGKERKGEVDAAAKVEAAKPAGPSIQDRLRDAAGAMCDEIDGAIDSYIMDPDGFNPKEFKIVNALRGKGAKAAHARIIKGFYERQLAEYEELQSKDCDEQLWEGYSHYGKKNIKKMHDFLLSIMAACDQIVGEAKLTKKPRVKKVKPAEQVVAKLKFKATDDKLGVTSVPPAQIVGASGAVVYNTKTRKLGIYTALNSEGLGVKGTTITNFTEKSTQKTLRKPEVQLREFKEQNTANRVNSWFGKIKATEIALNGRVNADVIILKVFK